MFVVLIPILANTTHHLYKNIQDITSNISESPYQLASYIAIAACFNVAIAERRRINKRIGQ